MQQVIGAIYAGGRGRRLGGVDKALLKIGDRHLFEIVADKLSAITSEIILLAPERPEWAGQIPGAHHVSDALIDGAPIGPAGGLLAALRHICETYGRDTFLLTHPVDAPNVSADMLEGLKTRALVSQMTTLVEEGEFLQPAFGMWKSSDLETVETAIQKGERALHSIAREIGAHTFKPTASSHEFLNINTPDDLAQATRHTD